MIKLFGMSSTLLIIQALHYNDERQHCIQLKKGLYTSLKVKHCPLPCYTGPAIQLLPRFHNAEAAHSVAQYARFLYVLCCSHERGRQMCQPRMIAMHTGGLNTHFVFIFLCFALMKTHTPPIDCFQSAPSLCVAEVLGYCFSPHFSCCSCGVFIHWLQDLDPTLLPQIFCSIMTRIELL